MDLDEVFKILHSLHPEVYIKAMHKIHLDYPLKTKEVTKEIINRWRNDHSMKAEDFNRIVAERKEEYIAEAKVRRQEGRRRIQERWSRTGVDPVELFPKEIWAALLDELGPEDKRNIREVHEIFRDLTEDTHVGSTLLPLILGFKVERFWGEQDPFRVARLRLQSEEHLALFSELRLLSKSMRNAVDQWFENDLISRLHSGDKTALPLKKVCADLLSQRSLGKISKMKTELSYPHPPRIFSRSLSIVLDEGRYYRIREDADEIPHLQLAEFPLLIDALLDCFGNQIWYFSFTFNNTFFRRTPSFKKHYISLLGWLSRMPNLKWFKISLDPWEWERDTQKLGFQVPEGLSPPALNHLERLDLESRNPNRYLLPAFNEILTAYSHVKILNLTGFGYYVNKLHNGIVLRDPVKVPLALEVLSIEEPSEEPRQRCLYVSSDEEEDEDEEKEDEEDDVSITEPITVTITNHPLKRIDLKFKEGNPYEIFFSLNHFQTLEKVSLTIDKVTIYDDTTFLKLPNLTHFELAMKKLVYAMWEWNLNWSFFFSLQFLLHAKKLNTLIWKCNMNESIWEKVQSDIEDNETVGSMIDFCGGIKDIDKDSNLWHVFPWLATVKVDKVIRAKSPSDDKKISKEYRR